MPSLHQQNRCALAAIGVDSRWLARFFTLPRSNVRACSTAHKQSQLCRFVVRKRATALGRFLRRLLKQSDPIVAVERPL
jgi:hypothetical protein